MVSDDYRTPPISNPEMNGRAWVFGSKLETYPHPNYLGIHTRAPLCKKGQWYSKYHDEKVTEMPILTQALIAGLEEIKGVTEVQVQPYRVSIVRAQTYAWEEILEKALPVFVSYCPAHH